MKSRALFCVPLVALLVSVAPAQAADSNARYALVHGCYAVRSLQTGKYLVKSGGDYKATGAVPAAGEPIRMQATALGRYLFYGHQGDFLTTGAGNAATVSAATPGPSNDLGVNGNGPFTITSLANRVLSASGDGTLTFAPEGTTGPATQFAFDASAGCADFPEAALNETGTPSQGPTPYSQVTGMVDAHMHMMAFEFLGGDLHCGRPWSPYGVAVALPDCSKSNAAANLGRIPVEAVLTTNLGVDPVGWPSFKSWPAHNLLTYENSYYRWLQRSWMAGQRVFVNLFVENHALCTLFPVKRNSCNEMTSVRLQHKDIYELQDYIDAQAGGPGKGFFRIVTDPFQARRVINSGKLAVVLGIEVSNLFDCGLTNGIPNCDMKDIDARLSEAYNKLGVRDMELINKFDNAFGGVAGDAGTTGVIVNVGNRVETGQFWQLQTCNGPAEESDHQQLTLPGAARDSLVGNLMQQLLPAGALPIYPAGPHCNTRGLSILGEHLVREMMQKGMIIDPDHLDAIARKQLLSILESKKYSGVISSHSWSTNDAYPRIYKLGGMITPYAGNSSSFLGAWKKLKKERDKRFYWGFGWGADMNGFGGQGAPRNGPNPVTYPFKAADPAITVDRQTAGNRVYDINKDGVSQYGAYPDWVQDLRMQAGDEIVNDLKRGAEMYLEMWERADGIANRQCRAARLKMTGNGLGEIGVGMPAEELLRGAGQPSSRIDRTWSYCVKGTSKSPGHITVAFSPQGNAALLATTAPRNRIAGVGHGSRASAIPSGARSFGRGVMVAAAGKGRSYVYGVGNGRVRFVALATTTATKSPAALRAYLQMAKVV